MIDVFENGGITCARGVNSDHAFALVKVPMGHPLFGKLVNELSERSQYHPINYSAPYMVDCDALDGWWIGEVIPNYDGGEMFDFHDELLGAIRSYLGMLRRYETEGPCISHQRTSSPSDSCSRGSSFSSESCYSGKSVDGMGVKFPESLPFEGYDMGVTKEQGLKVLEEAAELVEAVKEYVSEPSVEKDVGQLTLTDVLSYERTRTAMLDEAMDVYQTLSNLLAGEFTEDEVAEAYGRCVERNRKRGRY